MKYEWPYLIWLWWNYPKIQVWEVIHTEQETKLKVPANGKKRPKKTSPWNSLGAGEVCVVLWLCIYCEMLRVIPSLTTTSSKVPARGRAWTNLIFSCHNYRYLINTLPSACLSSHLAATPITLVLTLPITHEKNEALGGCGEARGDWIHTMDKGGLEVDAECAHRLSGKPRTTSHLSRLFSQLGHRQSPRSNLRHSLFFFPSWVLCYQLSWLQIAATTRAGNSVAADPKLERLGSARLNDSYRRDTRAARGHREKIGQSKKNKIGTPESHLAELPRRCYFHLRMWETLGR